MCWIAMALIGLSLGLMSIPTGPAFGNAATPWPGSGSSDMLATYDEAMRRGVFPHEGGYSNHPADPGGPTNWGITLADARMYWKPGATAADVKAMPKDVAEDIYAKHYATPLRYNDLPAGVDYSIMDYGVNSGIGRAGKVLRRLVELPDNVSTVTDEVIAAVAKRDAKVLIAAINDERLRFLKSLKTWPVFGEGWGRRVAEVKSLSLTFAGTPTAPVLTNALAPGKAAVAPPPTKIGNAVVVAGGSAGTGLVAWCYRNPALATAAAVGVVLVIGGVVYLINKQHQNKQEAPTPGIEPVPVAA